MECHIVRINVQLQTFVKIFKTNLNLEPCATFYNVSPEVIKFFIQFNREFMHPVKDVLRMLNEELEKQMISKGWDKFFIRENNVSLYSDFRTEWECIYLNLIRIRLKNVDCQ